MDIGEVVKGDSGKDYSIVRSIYRTKQSEIFLASSLDEGNEQRILKMYNGKERKDQAQCYEEKNILQTFKDSQDSFPGVVYLFDNSDKNCALILEYVPGMNLEKNALEKGLGKFHLLESLSILLPITESVAKMHSLGILHRDLKSNNILLANTAIENLRAGTRESLEKLLLPGEIKICDFGLSIKNGLSKFHDFTLDGFFVGTLKSCSPEIVGGFSKGDFPSDVWALGIMIYDLLYEGGLFHDMTPRRAYSAIVNHNIPRLQNCPEMEPLVDSMLAYLPEERPSIEQVRDKLKEIYRNVKEQEQRLREYSLPPMTPQSMGLVP